MENDAPWESAKDADSHRLEKDVAKYAPLFHISAQAQRRIISRNNSRQGLANRTKLDDGLQSKKAAELAASGLKGT